MRLNSLWPFGIHKRTKLTIGIPHRQDWYGFWATWHSLVAEIITAGLQDVVELVVIDQSPDHEDGKMVAATVGQVASNWQPDEFHRSVNRGGQLDARYIPKVDVLGTAAAKSAVFANARGEWVLVLDSHIVLDPGTIPRLHRWLCKRRNRNSRDLYHGVLLMDNHTSAMTDLKIRDDKGRPAIGKDGVFGKWNADPRGAAANGKPFVIDASGGWAILSRRDEFLACGFHPLMRGFGGEEGFLGERVRKCGHKVKCLPFLRGVHRFGRRDGDLYVVTVAEKLRNHIVGALDVDIPLGLIKAIWLGQIDPDDKGQPRLPEADIDRVIAETASEFQQATMARQLGKPPESAAGNGCCGKSAPGEEPPPAPLQMLFNKVSATASDINEHLPVLKQLAEACSHVTEFGTRDGASTIAFLAAQPKFLNTYDVVERTYPALEKLAGKTALHFFQAAAGNTIAIPPIPPTDLLFIDTLHTADQLAEELRLHSASVSTYIVLHDTETYGEHGEGHTASNPVAGLRAALHAFLTGESTGQYWEQKMHLPNNNGLTVLTRK